MNERKNKFLKIGRNEGFISNSVDLTSLTVKENNIIDILKSKKKLIISSLFGVALLISILFLF